MKAYSLDLRRRVVGFVEAGHSRHAGGLEGEIGDIAEHSVARPLLISGHARACPDRQGHSPYLALFHMTLSSCM